MDDYIVHGRVVLTRRSSLLVIDGRHLLVYLWSGWVWLTQDNGAEDYRLAGGQSYRLERNGLVLVRALEHSVLTLSAPHPALYAARISLTPAGSLTPRVLYDASRERLPFLHRWRIRLARTWPFTTTPAATRWLAQRRALEHYERALAEHLCCRGAPGGELAHRIGGSRA
jgi:Protein of unknown function (DUF2917)